MSSLSPLIVAANDRQAGTLCPVCQQEMRLGDDAAVCQACGAVHHRRCWDGAGRCGSYHCAPSRRDIAGAPAAIQISADELTAAVPLPRRTPASAASDRWSVPPREEPRTSKLAVWAFIAALLGIPLFGIVTGLVAIIMACAALSAMAGTRLKGTGWAVAGLLVGVFDMVAWVVGLAVFLGANPQVANVDFKPDLTALQSLRPEVGRAMRANVLIESSFGGIRQQTEIGSGVILQIENGEALVVTNRHVVDVNHESKLQPNLNELNAHQITVKMMGQSPEPGRVVWVARDGVDAALVRVRCDTDEAKSAPWASATPMYVGQSVFAIGNPYNLGWSHTQGSISQFRTQGEGAAKIRVIQTQTPINPGNSGGGLYDERGTLIGINTWTNDKRFSEGISFAIALESILAANPAGLKIGDTTKPDEKQSASTAKDSFKNAEEAPGNDPEHLPLEPAETP